MLRNTSAGGTLVNHTLLHLANPNLPFGGVGESGFGNYHGRFGFLTFSHARAVLVQGRPRLSHMFHPPYARLGSWVGANAHAACAALTGLTRDSCSVRLQADLDSVRLKPDSTGEVRLRPDSPGEVRLRPDSTGEVRLKPDTTRDVPVVLQAWPEHDE